jgi:nicotinamide-nucleotide amidase
VITVSVERHTLGADPSSLRRIPPRQLLLRFVFGAVVSGGAGIAGKALGFHAAGVLLAFPSILPAALTLIERQEGTSNAAADARGAVIGAFALVAFAAAAMSLAARVPTAAVIVVASGAWLAVAALLYAVGRLATRLLGEQQYLPQVAVSEAQPLVDRLRRAGWRVAVAESCTGGALAALLTAVPQASQSVKGGAVAYTDDMKRSQLGVPASVLEREGAVSEAAAVSMADGARERFGADLAIAITGVIGTPADGEEPGTIYICVTGPRGRLVTRLECAGSPETERAEALRTAIRLAARMLDRELGG